MKIIQLSNNKGSVKVDDEMFEKLSNHNWYLTTQKYAATCINGKTVRMHRFIMNAKSGEIVDHINKDKLDNRKENLRIVDKFQSNLNHNYEIGKSGYRGVTRDGKRWRAGIQSKKVHYSLGNFIKIEDAAKAYNEAAIKLHGDFATLNEI